MGLAGSTVSSSTGVIVVPAEPSDCSTRIVRRRVSALDADRSWTADHGGSCLRIRR